MLKYIHTSWLHFILVGLAVMLDGGIALHFAPVLFKLPMSASPYLSLIIMMMPILTNAQLKNKWLYISAFLGGLVFDVFYSGIIGVATIGFPLTIWCAGKVQKYLAHSFASSLVVWFISMSIYLIFDYAAFGIINLTNLSFSQFILFHMFPTLMVNLLLLIIVYYVMDYLYHATRQPDISAYDMGQRDLNHKISLQSGARLK